MCKRRRLMVYLLVLYSAGFHLGSMSAVGPTETSTVERQERAGQKKKKRIRTFRWVNKLKDNSIPGVKHATFRSRSMKADVGYFIYLPPGYNSKEKANKRYPVVYYLHGGRPGNETRSVRLSQYIHNAIKTGKVQPIIYVFVNGGPVSHYNYPQIKNGMGEDVFVKELIPHIDKTYRTIAKRAGRAIEGFSQGGRGTSRIMFKHPELFCSAAPGGGGYATEKRISENDGEESPTLKFAKGYNTWDLARNYAKNPQPKLRILFHVGTKGFNYKNNLEYMDFLKSLKIPFQKLIVGGAPHSARLIYEKRGLRIIQFHDESFRMGREKIIER
ncbi:MAG: alpha/beta hydrolase [Gemmataceae bacterium]